jgi:hypothetical protein
MISKRLWGRHSLLDPKQEECFFYGECCAGQSSAVLSVGSNAFRSPLLSWQSLEQHKAKKVKTVKEAKTQDR